MTQVANVAGDRFVEVRAPASRPDVSIVVPVFAQELFVADAVRSVLAQREVVAEVIVSDDASPDATWDRVVEVVGAHDGPHGIVVRRGTTRLRRDHVAQLLERASCDVVVIAHGDDLSAPDRAATLAAVLERTGAAVAGSGFVTIGADAPGGVDVLPAPPPAGAAEPWRAVPLEELRAFHAEFTGAMLAVRRSALAAFPRLDAAHAACGHDWVLPFRGALAGGAVIVERPLVARRLHGANWSKGIWDVRRPESVAFGQALFGLSVLRPMRRDLDLAVGAGLVPPETATRVHALLAEQGANQVTDLLDAHDALVRSGRSTLWVSDDEAALAARGDLISRYARLARVRDRLLAGRGTARRLRQAARRRLRGLLEG